MIAQRDPLNQEAFRITGRNWCRDCPSERINYTRYAAVGATENGYTVPRLRGGGAMARCCSGAAVPSNHASLVRIPITDAPFFDKFTEEVREHGFKADYNTHLAVFSVRNRKEVD